MNQHPFDNLQPLPQMRSEIIGESKYDERGQHRAVDAAECAVSTQKIFQRLNTTPERIAGFCEKWQIAEFALFGSVLRDDFRLDEDNPSDIDVLYTHAPETKYGLEIFDMKEELEILFSRKVDFVSKKAIQNSRNWLRRQSILESAQVIYAKRSTVTR